MKIRCQFLLALAMLGGALPARAANFYIDCFNGNNANAGTADAPWQTLVKVTTYQNSPNPGFAGGDSINLRRDCTWNNTILLKNSGTLGNNITIDSYGGYGPVGSGQPPHLTGKLPIAANYWQPHPTLSNVYFAVLYATKLTGGGSSACGDATLVTGTTVPMTNACVKCWGSKFQSCIDQPIRQLNMVRFGPVWGNLHASTGSLTHDRDWFFDTNGCTAISCPCAGVSTGCTQILYVYSSGGNPATAFGQVFPIAVSGMDTVANGGSTLLQLGTGNPSYTGVGYVQVQHLLIDWFDSMGIQILGPSDNIWIANVASNSMVENGNCTGGACGAGGSQYTQVGANIFPQTDGSTGFTATNINLLNDDFMMNYIGVRLGNSALGAASCPDCVFTLRNNRYYGNRLFGLVTDVGVGGIVNADYEHYYANNLGLSVETDFGADVAPVSAGSYAFPALSPQVIGPGSFGPYSCCSHDILPGTPPWIREWRRWPAYTSITFDDPGLRQYSAEYFETLRPIIQGLGVTPSVAVVTGQTFSGPSTDPTHMPNLMTPNGSGVPLLQSWINAGVDVVAHSVSHGYTSPPAYTGGATVHCDDATDLVPCTAFSIQYIGTIASSVSMTISHTPGSLPTGGTLAITPSPYDACAYVNWDLTAVPPGGTANLGQIDTITNAVFALRGRKDINNLPCWHVDTTALDPTVLNPGHSATKGASHLFGVADVANADVKGSLYGLLWDTTANGGTNHGYFELDEFRWAMAWMNRWLTGLPTNRLAVMPGMYSDPTTQGILASLGYTGIRGTGASKPCCANTTTLANGYNVFDILSQGTVPYLSNGSVPVLPYQQMRQYMFNDAWKNAAWGRPDGYFTHINELTPDSVQNEIQAMKDAGMTFQTDTGLMNLLRGCFQNSTLPGLGVGYTGTWVTGSFYTCPALATGKEMDFRPTVNSPTISAGLALSATFKYDIMGNDRTLLGCWDIGAYNSISFTAGHGKH